MIIDFLLKSQFEKKLDKINENFNALVNKYIGDGIGAMLIVIILVVLVIVIIRRSANR